MAKIEKLSNHINKATQPKIMFAYAESSFSYYKAPKTGLSVIDEYLANADVGKSFQCHARRIH